MQSSTLLGGGEGVTLFLENEQKISWKNHKIEVDVSNVGVTGISSLSDMSSFEYNCTVRLNDDEIEILKTFNITNIELNIFGSKIKSPYKYKSYLNCIDQYQD